MSIWVTGSLEVRDSADKVVLRVGDSSATEGGGVIEAKVLSASDPAGFAGVTIIRDDSSITTNDSLGAIQIGGNDPSAFQPGFMAIAEAAGNWASNYVQATSVRFYTQDSSSGINKIGDPGYAVLMISGANSNTTEFGVPLNVAGATHTKKTLQVGVSQNGGADPVNTSTGYIFRVSNDDGPNAGVEVDSDGSGVSSIFFNRDGANTSAGFGMGIFVDHGSTQNRFSIRKYATEQGEGAIVIHDNGNSVRVGGGTRRDTYDDAASLVVTASAGDRNPHVLIRSRFATRDQDNQPTMTLDYDDTSTGTANGGTWHFTVGSQWARNSSYRPLIIGSEGVANSNFSRSPAITIAEGGDTASVGIGGSDIGFTRSTAAGIYPRSMNPTGSLHVENENSAELALNTSLDKTTLLLGNSDDATGRQFAELSFDVARDYDPGKRTAAITVVRSGSALSSDHKGNMHFRLYDGSGNSNSTRTRMRIDDQGAMLIFSGTHAVQGGGYPNVRDNNLEVGTDVPSGSLTLIAQGGSTNSKPEVQPTLNFMLYTGTTDTDGSRAVSQGDALGRIAWWSNDNNLSAENQRVAAFIEATAATNHDGSSYATGDLTFYTRRNGELSLTPMMALTSNGTVDLTAPSGVTITGDATFDGKIQKTGDLTVDVSGDIALSADGDQITMDDGSSTRFTFQLDTSPEIDVDGDFKLDGSGTVDIVSVGDMTLDSNTDIILSADGDQIKMDDGTTTRFTFNVDSTPQIDAVGALTITSDSTMGLQAASDLTLTTAGGSATLGAQGHLTGSTIKAMGTTGLTLKNGANTSAQQMDFMLRYDTINNISNTEDIGTLNFKHYTNSDQTGTTRAQISVGASSDEPDNGVPSRFTFSTSGDVASETLVEGLRISAPFTTLNGYPQVRVRGGMMIGDSASTNDAVMQIRARSEVSATRSALDVSTTYATSPSNTQKPVAIFTGETSKTAAQGVMVLRNTDTNSESGDVILHSRQDDTTPNSTALHFAAFTTTTLVGGYSYTGVVTPFTGRHYTKLDGTDDYRLGAIMKSTGELIYEDQGEAVDNAWVKSTGTTTAKEPGVVGVYSGPCPGAGGFDDAHGYNAIGEGKVLVTDEGGNIAIGDYICSSNRAGHGMKQDDDLLHNYTVAKALTTIDWDDIDTDPDLGFKSALVACTYHCG